MSSSGTEVAVARAAFLDDWRVLAALLDGGNIVELPGVMLVATGLRTPILNKVFVTAPPEHGWIDEAVSFFSKLELPYSIEVRQEIGDAGLEASGFTLAGRLPFLVWAPISNDGFDAPDGYVIDEAGPGDDLAGFAAAAAEGFEMPLDLLEKLGRGIAGAERVRLFVARAGAEAVGTAIGISGGGGLGVYTVATIPAHRSRGLGAALTAAAARAGASDGCTLAYLQASTLGLPVYERMGFRTVARDPVWMPASG